MSYNYTKLFSSITESTIWCEPAGTRLVWITMLAKVDRHGRVFGSVPGLARLSNVTLEECETALKTLLAPDPYSRTPENEGRRVEPIDGGWRLLNYDKYRDIRHDEDERERKRKVAAEIREKKKVAGNSGNTLPPKSSEKVAKVAESSEESRQTAVASDSSVGKAEKEVCASHTPRACETEAAEVANEIKLGQFDADLIKPYEPQLPKEIDRQVFADYVKHRNVKRAPLSAGAWKMLLLTFKDFTARKIDINASLKATMFAGLTTPIEPKAQGSPRAGPNTNGRPSMNADFTNAVYQGTPDDQLPVELRPPPKPARGITPFDPDAIES